MPSIARILIQGIRSGRMLSRTLIPVCALMPATVFGQQPSNPVDVNGDGIPDLMEYYQYFGGGTSGAVGAHTANHPDNALLVSPSGVEAFAAGAVLDGSLKPSSVPSVMAYGHYGFRFRAADGLHYGWFLAAQPLVPGGGFWPNFIGVTVRSSGYNPVPDEPFAVGTPTPIVLKASVVGGRLRLSWNGNASPSGIRVESRPLRSSGTWTLVQTVSSGNQLDLGLSGEGRMYRAIRN